MGRRKWRCCYGLAPALPDLVLRELTTRYHLLQNSCLDGANGRAAPVAAGTWQTQLSLALRAHRLAAATPPARAFRALPGPPHE